MSGTEERQVFSTAELDGCLQAVQWIREQAAAAGELDEAQELMTLREAADTVEAHIRLELSDALACDLLDEEVFGT